MKIAMIGAGFIAGVHLNALGSIPGVQLVGHVTPVPSERDAASRRWGGRSYATLDALLDDQQVDAAWVTVPPDSHGQIERSLIARRIPFFVEKPLSADRETAEEIGRAIAEAGLIVGVGYHWRAMDTIPLVRAKLADRPARMVMGAWHDATPPPAWWIHQATCGGQMVEQATHLFDLARSLAGEATVVSSVAHRHDRPAYPTADVADVSAAMLQFADGNIGVFSATCLLGGPAAIQLQLICEGLLITITQTHVYFDYGKEKQEIKRIKDPFLTEDEAFLQAITRQDPSSLFSSYADALATHRLLFDVQEMAEAGQRRAPGAG